jgi:hypothetical protein
MKSCHTKFIIPGGQSRENKAFNKSFGSCHTQGLAASPGWWRLLPSLAADAVCARLVALTCEQPNTVFLSPSNHPPTLLLHPGLGIAEGSELIPAPSLQPK